MTLRSGGNSTSSRFICRKVWTGVKCNFPLEHFQKRYIVGKLSISWVRMWNFTRIGPKTKKLWLSIIPALRRSYQPRLAGQPQKGVNRNFSWLHFIRCSKAVDLGSLNMQFQQDWPKDKKSFWSFNFLPENLEKFPLTELYGAPLEGSTIFL